LRVVSAKSRHNPGIGSSLGSLSANQKLSIKMQREMLLHANIQTTMNIYTQAVSGQKRAANSKVAEMVLRVKARPGRRLSANGSVTGADHEIASLPQTASSD
jgi:hypothetical protein